MPTISSSIFNSSVSPIDAHEKKEVKKENTRGQELAEKNVDSEGRMTRPSAFHDPLFQNDPTEESDGI